MAEPDDEPRNRPPQPQARPRLAEGPQARRPRPRLRPRQDVGPRPQGLRLALGRQAAHPLRGRPEPAPHADAQAARPEQEDVDAVRAVPDAHAAREPGRPRPPLRRRRRGRRWPRSSAPAWRPSATSRSRSSAAASSTRSSPSTRTVLEDGPRADRVRRRDLPAHRVASAEAPRRGLHHPQRLQGRGDPQEDRLHGGAARALPARLATSRSRASTPPALDQISSNYSSGNILGFLNLVHAAAGCRGSRSSRSGSCRTSRPRSSCSC